MKHETVGLGPGVTRQQDGEDVEPNSPLEITRVSIPSVQYCLQSDKCN